MEEVERTSLRVVGSIRYVARWGKVKVVSGVVKINSGYLCWGGIQIFWREDDKFSAGWNVKDRRPRRVTQIPS